MNSGNKSVEEVTELLRALHDYAASVIATGMIRASRHDPYFNDSKFWTTTEDLAKRIVAITDKGVN